MSQLIFDAPDPREGERLSHIIETETGSAAEVTLKLGQWHIRTEADRQAVALLVASHDGDPEPDLGT